MKNYTVMVKIYGFITVEAEDDEDALEQVYGLSSSDFDLSDFCEAQIVGRWRLKDKTEILMENHNE